VLHSFLACAVGRALPPPWLSAGRRPARGHGGTCLHRVWRHPPRHPAAPWDGGMAHLDGRRPDGEQQRLTCRHTLRRRAPAATQSGGTLHVSPGGAAATHKVVFFVNLPHRWSFLSMNWGRWSLLSKFLIFGPGTSSQSTTTACVAAYDFRG
jgi:hypothetical protein